jgi:hypothetical protein
MTTLAGVPFVRLEFDKDGDVRDSAALGALPDDVTDLIVMSHGWKNDADFATQLYESLLRETEAAAGGALPGKFAAAGVYWPAMLYRPDLTLVPDDFQEGGAAGLDAADIEREALEEEALRTADFLGIQDRQAFADQALRAAGGGGQADALVDELRAAAPPQQADPDALREHGELFDTPGSVLVEHFRVPRAQLCEAETETGSGAGFGSLAAKAWRMLSGPKAAVATVLNQFTYFEMKKRAGLVGEGLARLLDGASLGQVRVHLVGHSFGARVVTSAASRLQHLRPASLILLQGAFSHNALGRGIGSRKIEGAFRNIIESGRVDGPIVVTHTHNDSAVGFFYALASKVSGEIAAATGMQAIIGGPKDLHGGIGANGALALADGESVKMVATPGAALTLERGKVNNILCDSIVTDHMDVMDAEIGRLIWAAVRRPS